MLGWRRHEDVREVYAFRRGLITITVDRPRAPGGPPAAQPSLADDTEESADKAAEVMVNLFTAIVDPVASRTADLLVSVTAGGVAGAMAGASGLTMVGMAGTASGIAIAPFGALFGGVISLSTDFAASKFEERLNRPSFEQNMLQIVNASEDAVTETLTSVLDEHIDAFHADVLANTSIGRLVASY
jgi:hypothetical protein